MRVYTAWNIWACLPPQQMSKGIDQGDPHKMDDPPPHPQKSNFNRPSFLRGHLLQSPLVICFPSGWECKLSEFLLWINQLHFSRLDDFSSLQTQFKFSMPSLKTTFFRSIPEFTYRPHNQTFIAGLGGRLPGTLVFRFAPFPGSSATLRWVSQPCQPRPRNS